MLIEADLSIAYLCSIASIIDISLTYYILWWDRKVHPNAKFQELNVAFNAIMKATKYGPWGLFFGAIISQTLIWTVALGVPIWFGVDVAFSALHFLTGALFVVIWIHLFNIQGLHKAAKARSAIKEILNE